MNGRFGRHARRTRPGATVLIEKTSRRVGKSVLYRGLDARTYRATQRPDPGMGKAEWWAVKTGRQRKTP